MIKSSFVKQCVKQCVKQALAPAPSELGRMLGIGARKTKPVLVVTSKGEINKYVPFYKQLSNMGVMTKSISEKEYLKDPSKWSGYSVIAPTVMGSKGRMVSGLPEKLENKLLEARMYKKFMPRTSAGKGLMNTLNGPSPVADLDRQFGANKWLLKYTDAAATKPSELLKGSNIQHMARNPDGTLTMTLNNGQTKTYHPKDLMVQQMKNIAAPSYYSMGDKVISSIIPQKYLHKVNNIMRGTNEYRVHVMNGKVVPEGTIGRGTLSQYLVSAYSPIKTPDMVRAEQYAARVARHTPKKYRNGVYGMDIGLDAKTGRPFLIETNPGTPAGHSGFLDLPVGLESVAAAAQDRMPMSKKLKLGGLATAGVGTMGVGAYEVDKHRQQQEEPQSQVAGIVSRLKQHLGMQA